MKCLKQEVVLKFYICTYILRLSNKYIFRHEIVTRVRVPFYFYVTTEFYDLRLTFPFFDMKMRDGARNCFRL